MKTALSSLLFHSFSVVIFAGAAAACSSGSAADGAVFGSGDVAGTVENAPIDAVSAIAYQTSFGAITGLDILVSNKTNDCAAVHEQNESNLDLDIPGEPVVGQTYAVTDVLTAANSLTLGPTQAGASFSTSDATCTNGIGETAPSGTVTITEADTTHVGGTFDVTFPDGHVTGSFDALRCASASPAKLTCS